MDILKKAREKSGISQGQAAEALGFSTAQMISNIERGISFPPAKSLKKMCELYRADYETIAKVIVEMKMKTYREKLKKIYKV